MRQALNFLGMVMFLTVLCGSVQAEELKTELISTITDSNFEIEKVITSHLLEKTKLSGTLDLMDENSNVIRHLRLINFLKEGSASLVNFRDINSGEIVTVEFKIEKSAVTGQKIVEINPPESIIIDPNRVFTDDEIQNFMKEYIIIQSQISRHFSLFDEETNRLRNLELVKLDSKVRRLGVLFITSAEFKDIETNDLLNVDITVKNNSGKLEIQALMIRKVIPSQI